MIYTVRVGDKRIASFVDLDKAFECADQYRGEKPWNWPYALICVDEYDAARDDRKGI